MSNEKASRDNVWKTGAGNVSPMQRLVEIMCMKKDLKMCPMKRPVEIMCRKKGLEKAERREGILYIK